ncbi:MAG: hypothetical protein ABI678_22880, partial [Kofleriaceae bacterium]
MDDAQVDAAWEAGRAAWPGVELAREQLAAHVATLTDPLDRHGGDLYLAAGCLAGDPKALEHLDRELVAAGRGPIASIDANGAFVDEGLQRLRTALIVG